MRTLAPKKQVQRRSESQTNSTVGGEEGENGGGKRPLWDRKNRRKEEGTSWKIKVSLHALSQWAVRFALNAHNAAIWAPVQVLQSKCVPDIWSDLMICIECPTDLLIEEWWNYSWWVLLERNIMAQSFHSIIYCRTYGHSMICMESPTILLIVASVRSCVHTMAPYMPKGSHKLKHM